MPLFCFLTQRIYFIIVLNVSANAHDCSYTPTRARARTHVHCCFHSNSLIFFTYKFGMTIKRINPCLINVNNVKVPYTMPKRSSPVIITITLAKWCSPDCVAAQSAVTVYQQLCWFKVFWRLVLKNWCFYLLPNDEELYSKRVVITDFKRSHSVKPRIFSSSQ